MSDMQANLERVILRYCDSDTEEFVKEWLRATVAVLYGIYQKHGKKGLKAALLDLEKNVKRIKIHG